MLLTLNYIKPTTNFVVYETASTDFRYPYSTVVRMWIPKSEIETSVPDIFPGQITIMIMDDESSQPTKQEDRG